jgi:hypothetical protein
LIVFGSLAASPIVIFGISYILFYFLNLFKSEAQIEKEGYYNNHGGGTMTQTKPIKKI